jgi:hypothetical protein
MTLPKRAALTPGPGSRIGAGCRVCRAAPGERAAAGCAYGTHPGAGRLRHTSPGQAPDRADRAGHTRAHEARTSELELLWCEREELRVLGTLSLLNNAIAQELVGCELDHVV